MMISEAAAGLMSPAIENKAVKSTTKDLVQKYLNKSRKQTELPSGGTQG
jgi:hypothetical protein